MGIDVHLQREDGSRIASVLDQKGVIARLIPLDDERFPLLRYVDPYGDTVFNRRQAEQVLIEVELLGRTGEKSADELEHLRQLKELARQCEQEPHFYLRFVGD